MAESCNIRPMEVGDLSLILQWRNHPKICRCMLTQHEITPDEHKRWFEKSSKDPTRSLLIAEVHHSPIGYIQFSNVVQHGVADWGFYASPDAPKGSGRLLGAAALRYAFDVLHLHKVCGQAVDYNAASIALHEFLGFSREGVLRDQVRIDNVYHSLICFGLLQHEWRVG